MTYSAVLTRTAFIITWLISLMQSLRKSLMPHFNLSDRGGWKEEKGGNSCPRLHKRRRIKQQQIVGQEGEAVPRLHCYYWSCKKCRERRRGGVCARSLTRFTKLWTSSWICQAYRSWFYGLEEEWTDILPRKATMEELYAVENPTSPSLVPDSIIRRQEAASSTLDSGKIRPDAFSF